MAELPLPGTPTSTGLIHMPNIKKPPNVEYKQVGGFGPVSRQEALDAAKQAGVVERTKPWKVWVQRPHKEEDVDEVLRAVITQLHEDGIKYKTIPKEITAKAGFGVYYLYGDKVVMEHTSDPESKVIIKGKERLLPHVHVEVVPYADLGNVDLPMPDRLKEINNFKIFDDTGYSPQATRLVRLGTSDPSSKEKKPKFNHHIYYDLLL
jgi:hypothetical protein